MAEATAIALDSLLPGTPGSLNVGHPQACAALACAAQDAGAIVTRGVGDVVVTAGATPQVSYELDDVEHQASCRLVVGADGRSSSVRRQLGIGLHETVPRTMAAGLLVAGLREWPAELEALGTEGDIHYLIFPRPGGLARLYHLWNISQKGRFSGANREGQFLDAFRLRCLPGSREFVESQPAGPCASYPMNDTWTDVPFTSGAVLIGDAAGWSDPLIGQGLSIAMRDARMVADILLASSDWTPAAFVPYAEERAERMRRLRLTADFICELRCTFTPQGAARRRQFIEQTMQDPSLATPLMTGLVGPEMFPAEAFAPENFGRLLALN
jgi:2-polyprenyl-6-methoxyphenol hydroxylase-like FAD-dependent oxidoreductase